MITAAPIEIADSRASLLAEVQQHMRAQQWREAAELLPGLASGDPSALSQLNICRNLAALQQHRPHAYAAMMACGSGQRYITGVAASGHPTVFKVEADGKSKPMSPANQPLAALSSIFASIKKNYQAGKAIAILGIGDGYLLKSCALHPPAALFGFQQAIYLFEPDAQAVLACMSIHDYTGADGPIAHERFHWFIGPKCREMAREVLLGERFNPPPLVEVRLPSANNETAAILGDIMRELYEDFLATKSALAADYARIDRHTWSAIYSESPPRPPRVLFLTTRRSSVLQYSTADTADAFASLGWETKTFIEPKASHMPTAFKLAQMLAEFQPDLIFQIDHLRNEWAELMPAQVPFVCWIQDHLDNLTTREAGRSVGQRDFLLCGMPSMYCDRFEYPARQFLKMPKLTRVPKVLPPPDSFREDFTYVSSASQDPAARVEDLAAKESLAMGLPKVGELLRACGGLMIGQYRAGGSLQTIDSVKSLWHIAENHIGFHSLEPTQKQRLIELLFYKVNNALYRQQALRWVARLCQRHGLALGIWGPGWEQNPEFAPYARGKVAYGSALEELTRNSKFNLVLEPTLSISHQRLLDALVAGGFCLIRQHPANTLFQEFLNFLHHHASPKAVDVASLRRTIAEQHAPMMDKLLEQMRDFDVLGDPVRYVRELEEAKILLLRDSMLPFLDQISFNNEEELEARMLALLAEPVRRQDIAQSQRLDVQDRFSYAAGMRRMIQWIGHQIASEETHIQTRIAA